MPRKKATEGTEAKVASIEETSGEDVTKLLAEIKDLRSKLEVEKAARTEAETQALQSAQAQMTGVMQGAMQEVPTGKKIKVQVLESYETVGYKDDGRPILRAKFKQAERPTYFYKIDLPPVGGLGLTVNGLMLYHNTVYEFDIDTLRSVKDMVYRVWAHEASIHNSDENAYRKPQPFVVNGKTGQVLRG